MGGTVDDKAGGNNGNPTDSASADVAIYILLLGLAILGSLLPNISLGESIIAGLVLDVIALQIDLRRSQTEMRKTTGRVTDAVELMVPGTGISFAPSDWEELLKNAQSYQNFRRLLSKLVEPRRVRTSTRRVLEDAVREDLSDVYRAKIDRLGRGEIDLDTVDGRWMAKFAHVALTSIDGLSLLEADEPQLWAAPSGMNYELEQMGALKRGVVVRRIFVVRDLQMAKAHSTVVRQRAAGFDVRLIRLDNPRLDGVFHTTFVIFDSWIVHSSEINVVKNERAGDRITINVEHCAEVASKYQVIWEASTRIDDL